MFFPGCQRLQRLNCRFTFAKYFQVHITYDGDNKSYQIKKVLLDKTDKKIVRQLAFSNYNYAANAIWDKPTLRTLLLQKVVKNVQTECSCLCSRKNPSVLRRISPCDIVGYKDRIFETELKERSPILYSVLKEASASSRSQRKKTKDISRKDTSLPAICMAASLLLRKRCSAMSAIAYRMSTVLWQGGVKKQVWLVVIRYLYFIQFIETCYS